MIRGATIVQHKCKSNIKLTVEQKKRTSELLQILLPHANGIYIHSDRILIVGEGFCD